MPEPSVEKIAARLYALPPEQFTAARDAEVARARQAGELPVARELAALRRPTVAAWLVNLLAAQRPEQVTDLLALGDELRAAQQELRGTRLRELSGRRRQVVDGLAAQARDLALAAGRSARENLPLRDVVATLNAALADTEVADQVRAGRLVRPTSYAGFGEVAGSVPPVVEGAGPHPAVPGAGRSVERAGDSAAQRQRAARERAAHERLRLARQELAEAEAGYQEAAARVDEVAGRLAVIQHEHAAAQVEVGRATLRRKAAQRAVAIATQGVPDRD